MPRQARLDAPGVLHQVMARGIERTKIFRNHKDREDFLRRLEERARAGAWLVYAWALMPNWDLVRSGSRASKAVKTRRLFCQLAVKKWGYSGAEVARYLGTTTSSVNRLANAPEMPGLQDLKVAI
jgi:hypothetical protein